MSDTTVSRTLIILSGATWRAELTDELVRLGVAQERAPISAGRVLSRICHRAGYLNCFLRDEEALAAEAAEQEAVEDGEAKPPKSNRAESRRRLAEVTR
jgi:hypothetical protein